MFYHHQRPMLQKASQDIPRYGNSHKHRFDIRGFSYDADYKGKRAISIKADRFSIQKKKLGFFRFGLMNEARFENAIIHIYGRGRFSGNSRGGSHKNVKLEQNLTFKDAFSRESLPSSPIKRISSIVMEPVYVALHDEQSVVTKISASWASIRLKQRDILFKGNVRVASGPRVLKTARLSMLPEKGVMKTNRGFLLRTPGKELKGNLLSTDIFLNPLNSDSPISVSLFSSPGGVTED